MAAGPHHLEDIVSTSDNQTPGADEVRWADEAVARVHTYIDGDGVSADAVLGAYAQLATAAAVDALRATLSGQIETVAEQLAEIVERLDALDDA